MLHSLFGSNEEDGTACSNSTTVSDACTITGVKVSKPPEERSETLFVGLENQGATCYLNSLIQAMYMTPELRFGLYNVDPKELGIHLIDDYEKEKREESKAGTVTEDDELMATLMAMGVEDAVARRALIGVKNAGVMEALDYIEAHPEITTLTAESSTGEAAGKAKKKKPRLIPLELQRLYAQMQLLNRKTLSTEELTSRGFQWRGMDGMVQHDAHELNRLLIDALEKSLKHTTGEPLCSRLYKGTLANQTKCLGCLRVSEREESFYDLNVQVTGCADLATSLRQLCTAEVLEGDSAYQCDTCRGKRTALRSTVLKELPPVLTFSCNRFKIDRSTNWQRQKVISRCAFPLVLDMSHYIEGAEGVAELLYQKDKETVFMEGLRRRMLWLEDACAEAERVSTDFVGKYGDGVTYAQLSEEEKKETRDKLMAPARQGSVMMTTGGPTSDANITGADGADFNKADTTSLPPQQEQTLKPSSSELYQLFAVIMHRGSAHSGHYFAYIRDSLREGHWELPESAYDDPVHPLSSTGTGTAAQRKNDSESAPSGVDEKAQFIKLASSGDVLVQEESALACLVEIFKAESPSNSGASGGRSVTMTVDRISRAIKQNLNETWNSLFKSSHGTLIDFTRAHRDLFNVEGNSISVKNLSSISVVSREKFKQIKDEIVKEAETSRQSVGAEANSSITNKSGGTAGAAAGTGASAGADARSEAVSSAKAKSDPHNHDEKSMLTITQEEDDEALARALQESLNLESKAEYKTEYKAVDNSEYNSELKLEGLSASELALARAKAQQAKNSDSGVKFSDVVGLMDEGMKGSEDGVDVAWETATTKKKKGKGKATTVTASNTGTGGGGAASVSMSSAGKDEDSSVNISLSASAFASASASSGATMLSEADKEEASKMQTRKAIRKLANELLSIHHGNYFEFNDSVVKAMPIKDLEKAFEGRDSAYILVYRKQTLEADSPQNHLTSMSATASTSTSTSVSTAIVRPSVPAHWADKITEMNQSLTLARDRYKNQSHSAVIRLLCPVHLVYEEPLLLPVNVNVTEPATQETVIGTAPRELISVLGATDADSDATIATTATTATSTAATGVKPSSANSADGGKYKAPTGPKSAIDALPLEMASYVELTVDVRMTVREVLAALTETHARHLDALEVAHLRFPTAAAADDVTSDSSASSTAYTASGSRNTNGGQAVLSIVDGYGKGYHPNLPLPLDASIESLSLGKGSALLVWDGSRIGGRLVGTGLVNAPVRFSISLVESKQPLPLTTQLQSLGLPNEEVTQVINHHAAIATSIADVFGTSQTGASSASISSQLAKVPCVGVIERDEDDFWVSSSLTVVEACRRAMLRFGASADRACVHLIEHSVSATLSTTVAGTSAGSGSSTTGSTSSAISGITGSGGSNSTVGGDKRGGGGLIATPYWFGSVGKGKKIGIDTEQRIVGGVEGRELIVEDVEARGMQAMSLAEAEVTRRNTLWSVTVEADFAINSKDKTTAGKEEEDALDDSKSADAPTSVKLFVEKDISVYELKLRALLQLGALKAHDRTDDKTISDAVSGDSSVLLQTISSSEVSGISGGSTTTANTTSTSSTTSNDSTVTTSAIGITSGSASRHRETLKQLIASMRLRTGPSTGDGVLDDESLPLYEVGIQNGNTLTLERGKRAEEDRIRLRVALVRGNDPAVRFNPQRPGVRGTPVEIEVSKSSSLTDLRELAGVVLLGLPVGWTTSTTTTTASTNATTDTSTDTKIGPPGTVATVNALPPAPPLAGAPVSGAAAAKASISTAPPKAPGTQAIQPSAAAKLAASASTSKTGGSSSVSTTTTSVAAATSKSSTATSSAGTGAGTAFAGSKSSSSSLAQAQKDGASKGGFVGFATAPKKKKSVAAAGSATAAATAKSPAKLPMNESAGTSSTTSTSTSAATSTTGTSSTPISDNVSSTSPILVANLNLPRRLRRTNGFEECGDILEEQIQRSQSKRKQNAEAAAAAPSNRLSKKAMGMIFNMAGLVGDGKRGKQEQETTAATTGVDCKNAQAGKSANTSTVVSTNSAASASAIGGDGSSKQSQSQAQIQAQSQIQTQAQTQSLTRFDQLLVPVTIEQAGLQPNDLILLEEGPLPRRGMMKFKVYLWSPTPLPIEVIEPLLISRPEPEKEVVAEVAAVAAAPVTASASEVVSSDSVLQPSQDAPVSVPAATVASRPPQSLQSLAIAPPPAHIIDFVTLQMRHLLPLMITPTMINPGTALATATTAVEDFTTSSSYPNEEGGAYHVIELHEDSTVLDLQRAVFAKLQGAVEAVQNVPLMADWQAPASLDHFLLRELRSDNLPGRCLWTCEPTSGASANLTASIGMSIGVGSGGGGRGGGGGRRGGGATTGAGASGIAGGNSNGSLAKIPLKRLNLPVGNGWLQSGGRGSSSSTGGSNASGDDGNIRRLVVEVLTDRQARVRPPVGAIRLWAQRLENAENTVEGQSVLSPEWPPKQITINGGAAPSLAHLRRPICAELGLAVDKTQLFKFLPSSLDWHPLKAGMKSAAAPTSSATTTAVIGAGIGQQSKKIENIFDPPYSMREGDLVCAFEATGDNSVSSSSTASSFISNNINSNSKQQQGQLEPPPQFIVSRPIDRYIRDLLEADKLEKRTKKKQQGGIDGITGAGGKRRFTQEVALTLGGDLDFSEDEDEVEAEDAEETA